MSPGTVAVLTTARYDSEIDGSSGVCRVRLEYDPRYPLEVLMAFPGNGTRPWALARDLLALGLMAPAGVGDVQVEPLGDEVAVLLDGEEGRATVHLPAAAVRAFVEASLVLVPPGEEVLEDFDQELAEWLDGAR